MVEEFHNAVVDLAIASGLRGNRRLGKRPKSWRNRLRRKDEHRHSRTDFSKLGATATRSQAIVVAHWGIHGNRRSGGQLVVATAVKMVGAAGRGCTQRTGRRRALRGVRLQPSFLRHRIDQGIVLLHRVCRAASQQVLASSVVTMKLCCFATRSCGFERIDMGSGYMLCFMIWTHRLLPSHDLVSEW